MRSDSRAKHVLLARVSKRDIKVVEVRLRPQPARLLTHGVNGARQQLFPLAAPVSGLGHLDLRLRFDALDEHLTAEDRALLEHLVPHLPWVEREGLGQVKGWVRLGCGNVADIYKKKNKNRTRTRTRTRTQEHKNKLNTAHRGCDVLLENESDELPEDVALRSRIVPREECEVLKRPRRQQLVLRRNGWCALKKLLGAEETASAVSAAAASRSGLLKAHRRAGGVWEFQPPHVDDFNLGPFFRNLNHFLVRSARIDHNVHRLFALEPTL